MAPLAQQRLHAYFLGGSVEMVSRQDRILLGNVMQLR